MEYLEALAIRRLNPDNLPGHMAHLHAEADRVVKLHDAVCHSSDATLPLQLPVLPKAVRDRVNAVLIVNLAQECGRLACWGGRVRKGGAIKAIQVRKDDPERLAPLQAKPGGAANVLDVVVP